MKIHAFDPGKTTGYAILICTPERPQLFGTREIGDDPRLFIMLMQRDLMHPDNDDVILAEKFRLYPSKKNKLVWDDIPAAIAFGRVEMIAASTGLNMYTHLAMAMKPFEDPKLMARRLLLPDVSFLPKSEHCRDAIRHALVFYYNQYLPHIKKQQSQPISLEKPNGPSNEDLPQLHGEAPQTPGTGQNGEPSGEVAA